MSELKGTKKNEKVKVIDLKPEMNNLDLVVRVIKATEPKVINTRSGQRTISEATVGDETGRVKLTLWGKAAGEVKEGKVFEINGAWTTTYRGDVQLNIGGRGNVKEVEEEVPKEDEIPERTPKAPEGYRPQRRSFRSRRSFSTYRNRYNRGNSYE